MYRFWRQLENLPLFMQHLESVTQTDNLRSHWVAKVSTGNALTRALPAVEWDAEIVEEQENSRLVWRSVPGATVDNSGEVWFMDAPGQQGTQVHAIIKYRAPEGIVGEAVAKLLNPAFGLMIQEDIRQFKKLLESSAVPAPVSVPEL
ncbi:putative membrane protein [Spirosoma lacussanchae]|uniref:SRPBCC family protein n=1 Tax=Spirosoma lacussanchae TaxID=1884249 RepID=UPI001FEAB193|nr:SRPBCC family protein [Spirosoma lacussanchae]